MIASALEKSDLMLVPAKNKSGKTITLNKVSSEKEAEDWATGFYNKEITDGDKGEACFTAIKNTYKKYRDKLSDNWKTTGQYQYNALLKLENLLIDGAYEGR